MNIFFDAEGTLYVPKKGFTCSDFWKGEKTLERALEIFELDGGVKEMLEKFKDLKMYVLSIHIKELLEKILSHFGIIEYFEDVLVIELGESKAERMKEYSNQNNILLQDCMMIGDTYIFDIKPMKDIGVKALLVNRSYNTEYDTQRIMNITDICGEIHG